MSDFEGSHLSELTFLPTQMESRRKKTTKVKCQMLYWISSFSFNGSCSNSLRGIQLSRKPQVPRFVHSGHCGRTVLVEQDWEHLKTKQLKQLRQKWPRLGSNMIAAIKPHFELPPALMVSFFLSKVYRSFPDLKSTS